MKKLLAIVLMLVMVVSSASLCFADIDYGQWDTKGVYPADVLNTQLATPVIWLVDKKIVDGYDDGLFHPDWNITRAQFAKMMLIATNNHADMPAYSNTTSFTDTGKHWAHDYIEIAASKGFINGYPDGTFKPDANVSYVEAAAIFCRMRNISVTGTNWPYNYIQQAKLVNLYGLTVDTTNWSVEKWNTPATRADIAWMMYRNLPK